MNIGDSVCCTEELQYVFRDQLKKIKVGHALILKNFMGDKCVLERFNKSFIVDKSIVFPYPLPANITKKNESKIQEVAVLDDNKTITAAIKSLIESNNFKDNFNYYNNPKEFLHLIEEGMEVDFLICDIRLGDLTGIDIVKKVKGKIKKILIMSSFDDYEYIKTFFDLGVNGYLIKDDLNNLPSVINLINNGGTYYPQQILYKVLKKSK